MKKSFEVKRLAQIALAFCLISASAWAGEAEWNMSVNAALKSVSASPEAKALKSGLPVELAQAGHNPPQTPSIYDQLKADFDQAQLPEQADLMGWHEGRCYQQTSGNIPVEPVHMLVGMDIPPETVTPGQTYDNGQQFPPTVVPPVIKSGKFAFAVANEREFQSTNSGKITLRYGVDLKRDLSPFRASTEDGSLVSTDSTGRVQTLSVRKRGPYLVAESGEKGEYYCYFFGPNLEPGAK